jgi:thiol-disulfide isomerase/thioredoxin
MRRILGLVVMALVLAACGGDSGQIGGDERSFVSGDGTITVLASKERTKAPTLEGLTLDGEPFDPAQLVGKVSVINLWASWCAPCRAEAPTLVRLAKEYEDVAFVGMLTRDNIESAQAFVRRFGLNYPTIASESLILKFRGTLAPNAIPTTLVLDRQGRIAARLSGEVSDAGLSGVLDDLLAESSP